MTNLKQQWMDLRRQYVEAVANAEPARIAYDKAMEPADAIQDQIEALLEENETDVTATCLNCSEPIFDGDPYSLSSECDLLCKKCSPTYGDILRHPEHFENIEGERMSAAEAKDLCDAHVASGGSIEDSLAT